MLQEDKNSLWNQMWTVWPCHLKLLKGYQDEGRPGRKGLIFRELVCDTLYSV